MAHLFPNEKPAPSPEGSELIATLFDPIKVVIVKGILESEEVPFLIKERGAGSYLTIIMGTSYLGTDVYVPTSYVDRALELLAPLFEEEENEVDGEEDEVSEDEESEEYLEDYEIYENDEEEDE